MGTSLHSFNTRKLLFTVTRVRSQGTVKVSFNTVTKDLHSLGYQNSSAIPTVTSVGALASQLDNLNIE